MPIDPNAPELAPIEGVTLEQYAEVAVGMQGLSPDDDAGMRAYAESHGIAPGTWDAVRDGWNARFEKSPDLVLHWGDVYRQALAKGGTERPDITYEQYVTITAKRNKGVPLDDIYAEFDLTVATFALVSDYWVGELTKDPQLGARFQNEVKALMETL
jgi:hypothetical protein